MISILTVTVIAYLLLLLYYDMYIPSKLKVPLYATSFYHGNSTAILIIYVLLVLSAVLVPVVLSAIHLLVI